MFERAGAGLSNSRADRDPLMDSLLGISDTQRELAVELDVDPYTDFPPLAQRLKQMAGAMASGGLPIKAGLSFVPGGIGIAVSSVATVSSAKDTLRDKTAAQLIAEVRGILLKLDIEQDNIDRLLENRNYTPADLLIMARALRELGAADTNIFIEKAAGAGTRNYAFYFRRRRANSWRRTARTLAALPPSSRSRASRSMSCAMATLSRPSPSMTSCGPTCSPAHSPPPPRRFIK